MRRTERSSNIPAARAMPGRRVESLLQSAFRPAAASEELRERLIRESLNILAEYNGTSAQQNEAEGRQHAVNPLGKPSSATFRRQSPLTTQVNRLEPQIVTSDQPALVEENENGIEASHIQAAHDARWTGAESSAIRRAGRGNR